MSNIFATKLDHTNKIKWISPVVRISVGNASAVVTHRSVLDPISTTFKQNEIAVRNKTDDLEDAAKERMNEKTPPKKKNVACGFILPTLSTIRMLAVNPTISADELMRIE